MVRTALRVAYVLIAAGFTAATAAPPRADAPAEADESTREDRDHAKAEADRLLRDRGLRRVGPVYVLEREEEVRTLADALALTAREADDVLSQMRVREASAAQTRATIDNLVGQHDALIRANAVAAVVGNSIAEKPGDSASKATADQQRADLAAGIAARNVQILALEAQIRQFQSALLLEQFEYNRLTVLMTTKQSDFRHGQAALSRLAEEVRRNYAALSEDTVVKAALADLNKDSDVRYALGPREDYRANLQKMAAGVLKSKGFQPRRGGGLILGTDANLKTTVYWVETLQRDLSTLLARQQTLRRESELRTRRIAELEAQSPRPAAEIVRLRQEEADAASALKDVTADVAVKREGFVESVQTLRKAIDASRKKHEEVSADDEVGRALVDLRRKHGRPSSSAGVSKKGQPREVKLLEDAEKSIRAEEIPLTPDRIAPWVVATVNDVAGRRFVVDLSVDTVRVSGRFAASVHLDPSEGGTAPTSPNGMPSARPATLRSVRIGGFTVRDVPCLVLDGYDGPPVLGSNFFERFVTKLDLDANTLTLTEVSVKPHTPPKGVTPAKAKDRPKTGPARDAG